MSWAEPQQMVSIIFGQERTTADLNIHFLTGFYSLLTWKDAFWDNTADTERDCRLIKRVMTSHVGNTGGSSSFWEMNVLRFYVYQNLRRMICWYKKIKSRQVLLELWSDSDDLEIKKLWPFKKDHFIWVVLSSAVVSMATKEENPKLNFSVSWITSVWNNVSVFLK